MEAADEPQPRSRRFRRRHIFYGALFLFVALLLFAWVQRAQIADGFVQDELAKRNVRAAYKIAEIGLKTQRIEDVVIGDPTRPDLTANWVEIDVVPNGLGAKVLRVRADGVRLYGRLTDKGLSFGEIDKFRDPASTAPFSLPDIFATLSDARVRLTTDYGDIGLKLVGQGRLADGFEGQVAAVTDRLTLAGCDAGRSTFFGTLSIKKGQPHIAGPLRNGGVTCDGFAVGGMEHALQLTLSDDLKSWTGDTRFDAARISARDYRVGGMTGSVDFYGNGQRNQFQVDLDANGLGGPEFSAQRAALKGQLRLSQGDQGMRASFNGEPRVTGLRLADDLVAPVDAAARGLGSTPLQPILRQLATAGRAALRAIDLSATLEAAVGGAGTQYALLKGLRADAASGASARLVDDLRIERTASGWSPQLDGQIRLAGGGLPEAVLDLAPSGNGFAGRLQMADYGTADARLSLPELAFRPVRGGTDLAGRARMTGPLFGGYVTNLDLPVQGLLASGGTLALWNSCQSIGFDAFRLSSLSLGADRLRVCPRSGSLLRVGNGPARADARVLSPAVEGRLAGTPITIAANGVDVTLKGFAAQALAVRLGTPESRTLFDAASFTGRFGGQGLSGDMTGGAGRIGNVPLLLSEADGDWTLRQGVFDLAGSLRVDDAAQQNRFEPMRARDVTLRFADNRITATGVLAEPRTGTRVADVDLIHRFGDASGQADFTVRALRFDKDLQPDALTRLALGTVANVDGSISGTGRINWTGDRVTSTGTFTTDGLDLAAPFGPVENLAGTIRFTDLLGLETAPGQILTLGTVSPGLDVFDGVLRYRLLPGQRVQIEGADWPFAGGVIHLDPTILDMAGDAPKLLTFDVTGMDIAVFLQRFGFDNLQATGVFDGTLPMIFDQSGGRIEGGRLVSREGGGTIAYIGDLTYKDLSYFANLAFDMLKSIRYRDLTIGLDGDLGGEMVTQVKFSGLQQGEGAQRNFITREIAKLPIQFNVNVRGPFLQLIGAVKSYYDPSLLIKQNLPSLIEQQQNLNEIQKRLEEDSAPGVQPRESESMP